MVKRLFVVMATEDDYYPDIRAIGAFETEEAAWGYAKAQPRYVLPWWQSDQTYLRDQKRAYDYTVEMLDVEPTEPWCKEAS